jgi:hypothetical protein
MGLQKYRGDYTDLIYYDGPERYVVRFPKRRAPSPFISVVDREGIDVTMSIRVYAGRHHNFHGIVTTPYLLGYPYLKFVTSGGDEIEFTTHEHISFKI